MKKETRTAQQVRGDMGRAGFTLAEVLITLGVIGIVAALTMPALIANYQKQQTITHLKKVYSIINNAIKLMELDDNLSERGAGTDCSARTSADVLNQYVKPYFNVIKTCEKASDCGYPVDYNWISPDGTVKGYAMYNYTPRDAFWAGATLNDGTLINILHRNSASDECYFQYFVDLNGPKAPNQMGKDIFVISSNGGASSSDTNDAARGCHEGAWGFYCLSKIIKDGWEISDDYPW